MWLAPTFDRAGIHPNGRLSPSVLSFNVPVALPGVTLRSGTYIFELADPSVTWFEC